MEDETAQRLKYTGGFHNTFDDQKLPVHPANSLTGNKHKESIAP
jgi:hypothetical protein